MAYERQARGWKGVYDILAKDGYNASIVQEPETSFKDDVEATKRVIAHQDGPCILVAHSYGGAVATVAGNDPSVVGLVYVAAHMPDAGENEAADGKRFPSDLSKSTAIKKTADGFTFLEPAQFHEYFAADLPADQAAFMARSQVLNFADNFKAVITTAAENQIELDGGGRGGSNHQSRTGAVGMPSGQTVTRLRYRCSVWLEYNVNGIQTRKSAKTFTWETAQEKADAIAKTYLDAELGRGPAPAEAKTIEQAIALFMDSKRDEDLAENTLYKHTRTMKRLQDFCDKQGVFFAKDITLAHLTSWRATWPFNSPLAKRNNQERVKSFFKFCNNAGLIPTNPTAQLSTIQVKADEASSVRPFEPKEYKAVIAAVPKTGLLARNKARVKACMQLQRWSGLSLVDAVCLSKDELQQDGKGMVFRIRTQRRKTGAHINNVIPTWLGKELLKVKNGNPTYFFISGEATPKGAVSTVDKMYRQVFQKAGVDGTSHMFRHTFAVELLKAGVDIRKVSRALGHSSVTITERYYAKWNKAQQDILDGDLARAWKK